MKPLPRSLLILCLLAVTLLPHRLSAQGNIVISADENGNGTLVNPATGTFVLPASMQSDPGPGGKPSALNYNLLGPPGFVTGDVLLRDISNAISDVIRFSSFGGGSFFFYSLLGGVDLADTGLPSAFNTNLVSIIENEGGFTVYTPTAGQPGFVAGAAFPVTYRFSSGPGTVPEGGATLLMLGLGLAGLIVLKRFVPPAVPVRSR
jgi:hypothetical protein